MESKRVKTAVKTAVYLRNYQRARSRALTRLSNKFPEIYKEFLEEEKRRDELEGKKWHSITDSPAYRVGGRQGDESRTPSTSEGAGVGAQEQGNVGGEA